MRSVPAIAVFLTVAWAGTATSALAANLSTKSELPWGAYPVLDDAAADRSGRPKENLPQELRDLGSRVESTVKRIAARHNLTCFGGPCLFQAFPLVYNKPRSGFWGGVRANLTRLSGRAEDEPVFRSFVYFARADTQQYQTSFGMDFPRLKNFPLDPRFKFEAFTSKTTESRYFGTGGRSVGIGERSDDELRYEMSDYGMQSSLVLRTFRMKEQEVNLFTSFSTIRHVPSSFAAVSKLYEDRPRGISGGWSSRVGLGLQVDTRDADLAPRKGWALEISGEIAGEPLGNFPFRRLTVVDRRYFTRGRFTFGNRITVDALAGDPPFWELTSVGGLDPIRDVSYSRILRGYTRGRFHEPIKILESAEFRWLFPDTSIFGINCAITWIPVGVDLGRLGDQTALSASSGALFLFNRTFPIFFFASRSFEATNLHLQFEVAY